MPKTTPASFEEVRLSLGPGYDWREILAVSRFFRLHGSLRAVPCQVKKAEPGEIRIEALDGKTWVLDSESRRVKKWGLTTREGFLPSPQPDPEDLSPAESAFEQQKEALQELIPPSLPPEQAEAVKVFLYNHPALSPKAYTLALSKSKNLKLVPRTSGKDTLVIDPKSGRLIAGKAPHQGGMRSAADLRIPELQHFLSGLSFSSFPFGSFVDALEIRYGGKLDYDVLPSVRASSRFVLPAFQLPLPVSSPEEEFERIIEALLATKPVPNPAFPYTSLFPEIQEALKASRKITLTREEIDAAGKEVFSFLFPALLPMPAQIYYPEPPLERAGRHLSGEGESCALELSFGQGRITYSLVSGKVSISGVTRKNLLIFREMVPHGAMLEELYHAALEAFGKGHFSIGLPAGDGTFPVYVNPPRFPLVRKASPKAFLFAETFTLGGAYKRKIASLKRQIGQYEAEKDKAKAQQEKQEKKRKAEEDKRYLAYLRSLPPYGSIVPTAFLSVVLANERYCTEAAAVKFLRGLSMGSARREFAPSKYEGLFSLVPGEEFEEACDWLLKEHYLYTKTVKGTYGKFEVLKTNETAASFLGGEGDRFHRKQSEFTEYEMLDLFAKDVPSEMKVEKLLERAQYLTEHPAVYCCARETLDKWLPLVPDQIREYLQTMYMMESAGTRKKYLKALWEASKA